MVQTADVLHRRVVVEIQRKVIKQSHRSTSCIVHAKDGKDTIAARRLDLNRILHAFNVRSMTFSPLSLIVRFQIELAINTHIVVSNTHNIVSDMHHTIVKDQEGTFNLSWLVSGLYTLFNENTPLHSCLD